MAEGGIIEIKREGQEKVISFAEEEIENSPLISNLLCDPLITLSHKDNLKQEKNQLKELENSGDNMEGMHVLKMKESTHNSKYDSSYDKIAFTFESEIRFLRAELAKKEQMFKKEINFLGRENIFNRKNKITLNSYNTLSNGKQQVHLQSSEYEQLKQNKKYTSDKSLIQQ